MTNIVTYPTNPVQGQEFTVGETIKVWDGEKWVNKTPTNNPHNVTKSQVGLGDVDNVSAANLRDRGTHTGTQSLSTISDAGSAASKDVGVSNGVASLDVSGKVPDSESQVSSVNGKKGVVVLTAEDINSGSGINTQQFIDSFALKIFQAPTDGGLTEIQTRTVDAGEVYEVRKTSDDSLATIYSDAAGTTEISQNGTNNKSGSDGVVKFYIADGDYYVDVGAIQSNFAAMAARSASCLSSIEEVESRSFPAGTVIYLTQEGRSGEFVVKTGTPPSDPQKGIYISLVNGNYAERIFSGAVNICWFGAVSGQDSTSAIQAAVDMANKSFDVLNPLRNFTIYVPNGTFYISQPIFSENWYNFHLVGDGKRYNSTISVDSSVSESSPIAAMFVCGGGFTSNVFVKDITLGARNRAQRIVDHSNGGTRPHTATGYDITYKDCTLTGVRAGGYGVYGASYNAKFENIDIWGHGSSYDDTLGTWQGTGIAVIGPANGLYINHSYFRRLSYGVVNLGEIIKLSIRDTLFDNIEKYAVKSEHTVSSLTFDGNYLEYVGYAGKTDDIGISGGTQAISATIVLATYPDDLSYSDIEQVSIINNYFVSGASDSIIALSGIRKVEITGNNVAYKGGSAGTDQHARFVELFGYGTGINRAYIYGAPLVIEGNDLFANTSNRNFPAVEKIYEATGDLAAETITHRETGIVIKDSTTIRSRPVSSLLDLHPISFFDSGAGYTAYFNGLGKESFSVEKLAASGTPVTLSLGKFLPQLKGRYIRVEASLKLPSVGVYARITISDGISSKLLEMNSPTTVFRSISKIFYIDPDATELIVSYDNYGSVGSSHEFEYFNIVPAAVGVDEGYEPHKIVLAAVPTKGTWEKGDIVYAQSPSAGEQIGWVCVSSGTPGDWKTWGAISP